jgi:cystathionine beta-lyase
VLFDSLAHMDAEQQRFNRDEQVPTYGIFNMPQAVALENAVAELEGGYRAMSFPSGMAAVSGAILSCVSSGDHLLMTDACYDPARHFCDRVLSRFGVETTYYDPTIGADIASLMRPNTKAVYLESPSSITFEVQDIPAIAQVAHEAGASVILDNAWATGLYLDAFAHGVDVVVQPATKYYAGHADALIGLVVASESHWPRVKQTSYHMGQRAGTDEVFLTLRGMRTMPIRMQQQSASALRIAEWLQSRPEVEVVNHPALPSHPQHALWKRDFKGASGVFSFALRSVTQTQLAAFIDHLQYFGLGYSWGGFESLVMASYPTRTVKPWQGGQLVRLSIGLEDVEDLIADLEAGFVRLNGR